MDLVLTTLVDLLKTSGPLAVVCLLLFWLYWRADDERRTLSKELLELTKNAQSVAETWSKILDKSSSQR